MNTVTVWIWHVLDASYDLHGAKNMEHQEHVLGFGTLTYHHLI